MYVKHIYLKRPYQSDCPQRTQLRIAVHFTMLHNVTEIADNTAISAKHAAQVKTNSAGVTRPSPQNRLRRGESVPHIAGEHSTMALHLRLIGPAQTEQKPLVTDNTAEASQAYSDVKQYVESTTKEHHHAESLPA